jgi:hypothetical protein
MSLRGAGGGRALGRRGNLVAMQVLKHGRLDDYEIATLRSQ